MKTILKIFMVLVFAGLGYWAIRRYKYHRFLAAQQLALERRMAIKPRNFITSTDPDDRVTLRLQHPTSVQDEKALKGQTLWVSDGGQMDFYPYSGKSVDFSHSAGVLLGAEKIVVRDAMEQVVPKSADERFPDAEAEVLLLFVRPDDATSTTREYAVVVGDREGQDYNIMTDQLFFYDDPHQIYSKWGSKIWQAIDSHTAILGMTERQMQLALGQVSTPRGDMMGDRSVEFDNQGKPTLVTFVNGKASEIRDESR